MPRPLAAGGERRHGIQATLLGRYLAVCDCGIELACRVRIPLIMSVMSLTEGKVAYFDAATETIRMG
ncbi:MAG: hypothetical protein HY822_02385 [Acidobacteria bacterium]|nr:hypothetical protein [Acidobacteriota bacterium]